MGVLLTVLVAACSSPAKPIESRPPPCNPACLATNSCLSLDDALVDARGPMLACVGREAGRGNLAAAHRCYRSLRLLESARWWLKTLLGQDELHAVYMPSETVKRQFICRIQALTRAKTASEVERLYLEMIRSYP